MSLDELQHALPEDPPTRAALEKRGSGFEATCVSIVVHCIIAVTASLLVLAARDPLADRAELLLARGEQATPPTVRMLTPDQLAELERLPSPTDPPPVTTIDPVTTDPPPAASPPPLLATPSVDPAPVPDVERESPVLIDSESLKPSAPPVELSAPHPLKLTLKPMPAEPDPAPAADPSPEAKPPVASEAAPAAKQGVRTGADLKDLPKPRYPTVAVRKGQEGAVVLEVQVLRDGTVGEVRVLHDPGFPLLVEAAIDAVMAATFDPAMVNGEPVDSRITLRPIVFRIEDR